MAKQAVYTFMKTQNRPYGVNDVVSDLKQYSKSHIQKALDQLVEDKKIMEKINSKQKIYCIIQESKLNPKELLRKEKELQSQANELEQKLQNLQKLIKVEESSLTSLKSSLGIEEMLERQKRLKKRIKYLNRDLDNFVKASTDDQELPVKKRKLENDLAEYQREYSKRKRKCMNVVDCILENYPKKKQTLYDEVGLDVINI